MAKRKITIEVDEDIISSLEHKFPDITDKRKLISSITIIALNEWERWLAAKFRPKSISALNQERFKMIFEEPDLYAGKQVSRGILFNQFNIPYGEASYIERVFSEMDLPNLCSKALNTIVSNLDQQITEWKNDPKSDPDQSFTIEINKYGHRMLQSMMQSAKESGISMSPAQRTGSVDGYYTYTFTKDEANEIIKRSKLLLESYKS